MSRQVSIVTLLFITAVWSAALAAQAYVPVVHMTVTLPDGQTKDLSAHESGLAQVTLKDGSEYAFRPTMQDDKGSTTVVTIFKMSPSVQELGAVEVKLGAAATASKTTPVFRIAVNRVARSTT